jgi:GH15 family glucan-1,4-alpha-glucosidase
MSSKLMCWVALDRVAKLAEIRGDPESGNAWNTTADEIRADILLLLARLGARDRGGLQQARDLVERLLRIASPLGLYAEEFDSATGRHLGNFPQAFSHLALLDAAARIILPEVLEEY